MGITLGTAFYFNRNNLVVCMLTHSVYDMIGLTLIYLGHADALRHLGS